jgi:hypothetical protein
MPRVGEPTKVQLERRAAKERDAKRELFAHEIFWKRSSRGNLWRKFLGVTVTIFRDKESGEYKWCISDSDGPRYSHESFESEQDAIVSLGCEVIE